MTNLFRFDELQAKIKLASDGAHDILYENLNPTGLTAGQPYRRLLERMRTLYRPDDLGAGGGDPNALLPLGTSRISGAAGKQLQARLYSGIDFAGLPARMAPHCCQRQRACSELSAADGGGYVDLDGDGHWWIPSGGYSTFQPRPHRTGKSRGTADFFVPRRFEDPFGNATLVDYDAHDFWLSQTTDAVATRSRRQRLPRSGAGLLTDPNGNRRSRSSMP